MEPSFEDVAMTTLQFRNLDFDRTAPVNQWPAAAPAKRKLRKRMSGAG
jgi:hypothetical protein